jgi:hypothetical protein
MVHMVPITSGGRNYRNPTVQICPVPPLANSRHSQTTGLKSNTKSPRCISGVEGAYNDYGTFVIVPVTPTSRGNITLQSNSMLDPPVINPNWLTSQTDKELALQALKRGRAIISSAAMQPILIGNETAPGQDVQTDEQLNEYIRNNFFMNWHAAATCRMGSYWGGWVEGC